MDTLTEDIITSDQVRKIQQMTGTHFGALAFITNLVKKVGPDVALDWLNERGCPVNTDTSTAWWDSNFHTMKGQALLKGWYKEPLKK